MSKVYLIVIFVLLVAVGAWYTMKKPTVGTVPSLPVTTPSTNQASGTVTPTIADVNPAKNQIMLTVTSPANNASVTVPTVTVRGKTLPNAEVFVNDTQTKADATGTFAASVTLDEGENPIVIVANDDQGNSAEQELMVTYTAN